MVADRVQITVDDIIFLGAQGVEIAVLALAAAERNMHINTQRSLVGTFCEDWHGMTSGRVDS